MQGRSGTGRVDELGDREAAAGVGPGGLEGDEVAEEPERLALGDTLGCALKKW